MVECNRAVGTGKIESSKVNMSEISEIKGIFANAKIAIESKPAVAVTHRKAG